MDELLHLKGTTVPLRIITHLYMRRRLAEQRQAAEAASQPTSIAVFFRAAHRPTPMKQAVPESWLSKPARKLVKHVAKTVLGRAPDLNRLVLSAADGTPIDLSATIRESMTNGATYLIEEKAASPSDPGVPQLISLEKRTAAARRAA